MVKYIGIGAYTLQEAALYGSLSANKLSRWVWGTEIHPPVIESKIRDIGLISFYDLVQAMAINAARNEKISLQKIREAIQTAQDDYDVKFPLACEHKLLWFNGDLHIDLPERGVFQVSGRQRHQMDIQSIVETYAKDLHFDVAGLAFMWTPFKKYDIQIVLDPTKQFGQPLVGNTGYRADVLDKAFSVERSTELVASIYNIDIKDVKVAVAYMDKIRKAA
jgi:uncharacterized protein (DUF433 family)